MEQVIKTRIKKKTSKKKCGYVQLKKKLVQK